MSRSAPWVRVPIRAGERLEDAYERLALSDRVTAVAPEYEYRQAAVPDDPSYPSQWHLPKIGLEEAWEYGTGLGVTVAVLDSGVSTGGSDLGCHSFVHPYNAFTEETGIAAVADDSGHGTHITGTVAQCTDNGIGAAGVAPDASIMPVKVLDGSNGSSLELANGIHWAVDHGADIINLSLGRECSASWPTCNDVAVDTAIEDAHAAGVLVVTATGNEGVPWVSSPGNHPLSLAVGATTTIDTIAPYSNTGDGVDVVAPGGNWGDLDGDSQSDAVFQESFDVSGWGVLPKWGTSSAAAHVSGIAALMLSIDPSLTIQELESILESTSVDLGSGGWDPTFGAGRVNAAAAAISSVPPPITDEVYVLGGSVAVGEPVMDDLTDLLAAVPTRLAGADRYATAAEISSAFHPSGADVVHIVSGEGFADALSVGPVAALHDGPILLVTRTSVPQPTAHELQRLLPSEIVIVGGTAVINQAVADEIDNLTTGIVTRIAGPDRYATAAAVAQATFSPGIERVLLVTGESYPDGLSAGPAAARFGAPVLLSAADHLPAPTRAELLRLAPGVVTIVGGSSAVSLSVEDSVRNLGLDVERIAGPDRYATATALSASFFESATRPVFVATGEAFPDALSGAAAAGALESPLLLTRTASLPPGTRSEIERFFG